MYPFTVNIVFKKNLKLFICIFIYVHVGPHFIRILWIYFTISTWLKIALVKYEYRVRCHFYLFSFVFPHLHFRWCVQPLNSPILLEKNAARIR